MSLDQAIAHGKEHRQPYRRAKAVDPSCRNHCSCPACQRSRRRKQAVDPREIEDGVDEWRRRGVPGG